MDRSVTSGVFGAILMLSTIMFGRVGEASASEKPIAKRIADRASPSIFEAWNSADNLHENPLVTAARHDLIFNGAGFFGLQWNNVHQGLGTDFTEASIRQGRLRRHDLLSRNPNIVLIMEIRYRDASKAYLPDGHKWWRRDGDAKIVPGWEEGQYLQLDFSNPEYRAQVAIQAQAALESGVVDGIMLDWWRDDDDRLSLVQSIRNRIGETALVLVNANDRTTPKTAPYINGLFMECYRSQTPEDWQRIANTLTWAERNLRLPRINCLETWWQASRADESLMRATTTLSLVLSDGYSLFADPNPLPTPDHLHDWYGFWDRKLGKALAAGRTRPDGLIIREFSLGTVVYNPMGNRTTSITFDEPRTSRATGKRSQSHSVEACDGDLLFKDQSAQQSAGPNGLSPVGQL